MRLCVKEGKSHFKYSHRVPPENSDGFKGTAPQAKRTCQQVLLPADIS